MRICVFGAGAIGGHVATRLLAAGTAEVSVVARGAALKGMRERGLTLLYNGSEKIHAPVPVATDDPSTLPAHDYVVVTLKACALPAAAGAVARLLKPDGCAAFLNNGIPWWWPQGIDGHGPLSLLDPDGALWSALRTRTLGCVVYSPNEPVEPGVIRHRGANRWVMGEPDDSVSPRLERIVKLFDAAGLKAEVSTNVRREVWLHRHDPPAAARAGWIAACLNTPWPRSSWTACTSRTKSSATAARGWRSCPAGGGRWKACAGWRGTSRPQAIACSYTTGAIAALPT